jgi:transcriptional regulator with XRE-family HTH domain
MSQMALATAIGTSSATIARTETAATNALTKLYQIAAVLGLNAIGFLTKETVAGLTGLNLRQISVLRQRLNAVEVRIEQKYSSSASLGSSPPSRSVPFIIFRMTHRYSSSVP